ncbi:DUF3108 domain-containing protein [Inmirania thermothiophila]|uniref:Uncharacterized protein DUF3108 n=1 Tax=Inmirania thermothiophila TaxID=1750597 RepID=A0A3N1Y9A3_9GAMM|nr:DUF3108 domain-containing protein [Inmirania thermothiophila]ROR35068.1 uncharacterized protein DUF3108 [Inmirania thermothiophila]
MRAALAALAALALLLALPAASAGVAAPHEAVYAVHAGVLRLGEARYALSRTGEGRLRYRAELIPQGLAAALVGDGRSVEESLLEVVAGRLRPLRYHYRREGRKARTVAIDFQWAQGRAVHEVDGERWVLPLEAGVLDKLSVQLAVMADLAAGAETLAYRIADGGRLKAYRFRRLGGEVVETPAGRFETVLIERPRAKGALRFWCAPALDYLPVRVARLDEDGRERMRMVLVRHRRAAPAAAAPQRQTPAAGS